MKISRRILLAGGAASAFARPTQAYLINEPNGAAAHGWNVLKIGAGGQVTNLDYPTANSPFLITTDTGGAYALNKSTGEWVQLITKAALPSAFYGNNIFLNGAYSLVSAPSDPTRGYLCYSVWNGGENTAHILVSNNINASEPSTITFTDPASFSGGVWDSNIRYKGYGPKAAVDPANKDVVYVGTPHSGQFVSTDGGQSWSAVPNVPASRSGIPATGIVFDASSGTTGGKTNTIWMHSNGNGVWRSTNAGASFSHITMGTGPTAVGRAAIGIDGIYYAAEADTSKLWRFASNTWSDISPGSNVNAGIVVSHSAAGDVAVYNYNGSFNWTSNGNSGSPPTWAGDGTDPLRVASDIPWLLQPPSPTAASGQDYLNVIDMVMDPVINHKIWAASGVGVWYTVSTSGQASFTAQSDGIEQLVTTKIISPPGGKPVISFWDRAVFYIDNPTIYKSGYGPNYTEVIEKGFSVDYATTDPAYVALFAVAQLTGGAESAYSSDGGLTWTQFANFPNIVGGCIAVGDGGATTAKIVVSAADRGDVWTTINNGTTAWTRVDAPTVFGNGARNAAVNNMTVTAVGPGSAENLRLTVTGIGTAQNGDQCPTVILPGIMPAGPLANSTMTRVNGTTIELQGTAGWSGSLSSNGAVQARVETGWGIFRMANRQSVCADRTAKGTFYIVNSNADGVGGGFYKTTDTFATATKMHNQLKGADQAGFGNQIQSVPGKAGTYFYSGGQLCSSLYLTQNGGARLTAITGVKDVYAIGVGAPKPGNDYPGVYIVGTVRGIYSIFRSDDSAARWAANTVTWTDLGAPSIDKFTTISGDADIWGVCYVGGQGISCAYYTP